MERVESLKPTKEVLEEIYDLQNTLPRRRGLIDVVKEYLAVPGHFEMMLSISIVALGLGAIGFGGYQVKSSISYRSAATAATSTAVALDYATQPDLLGQRTKDTDNDGLSDYDELYVYGTSAYLTDSDSDGVDDKTELVKNTDPNCSYRESCFFDVPDDLLVSQSDVNFTSPAAQKSAQELRTFLTTSGVSAEDLATLNDADLAAAYQQALQQAQTVADSGNVDISGELSGMSAEQLRALLLQYGVSDNILNTVSDTELLQMAQQAMPPQ